MLRNFFKRRRVELREIYVNENSLKEAAEDYFILEDISDYVMGMYSVALFNEDELPIEAVLAKYAYYYHGEVYNGGHAQLIQNSQDPIRTIEISVRAFDAMGATAMSAIASNIRDWIGKNSEALKDDGFLQKHFRSFAALDKRFYAANEGDAFYRLARKWLTSLDNVRFVNSAQMDKLIRNCIKMNPHYSARLKLREIERVDAMVKDRIRSGLQVAAFAENTSLAIKAMKRGKYVQADGETAIEWPLSTSAGPMYGLSFSGGVILAQSENDKFGKGIRRTPAAHLNDAMAHADRHSVGLSLITALEQVKIAEKTECIACIIPNAPLSDFSDPAVYRLLAGAKAYELLVHSEGCVLRDFEEKIVLCSLTTKELRNAMSHLRSAQ